MARPDHLRFAVLVSANAEWAAVKSILPNPHTLAVFSSNGTVLGTRRSQINKRARAMKNAATVQMRPFQAPREAVDEDLRVRCAGYCPK
jgi:hypothetical protein